MRAMRLQDLLAPTWEQRARADDALMLDVRLHEGDWGDEVRREIAALEPSPEVFLQALVAFWGDVCAQVVPAVVDVVREPADWSSPHVVLFPMTTPAPTGPELGFFRSQWVWRFIGRLGDDA